MVGRVPGAFPWIRHWVRSSKILSCHADYQEVGRWCIWGESEESIVQVMKHTTERSILALKFRTRYTRSPKQGYQWPHKKDWCGLKIRRSLGFILLLKFKLIWKSESWIVLWTIWTTHEEKDFFLFSSNTNDKRYFKRAFIVPPLILIYLLVSS